MANIGKDTIPVSGLGGFWPDLSQTIFGPQLPECQEIWVLKFALSCQQRIVVVEWKAPVRKNELAWLVVPKWHASWRK